MDQQAKWYKGENRFQSSVEFLKKYLPSNIFNNACTVIKNDPFSMPIEIRTKAVLTESGVFKPLEIYDFDQRLSKLFFKKRTEDLSREESQHCGRVIDNVMVLIQQFYTFDFFPYQHILFDNFSNNEMYSNLQKVEYQIGKVNELIQFQKIITNPNIAKLELIVNENLKGKDNILSYKFTEQNFLSIEILTKVFEEKFDTWKSKTTELMIRNPDGFALAILDNIYTEEDKLFTDNYAFSRTVVRYAYQYLGLYVKPDLQSLEAIRDLLVHFKGKDNRKNKFYEFLGNMILPINKYLLDELQSITSKHSNSERERLELILNFILVRDIIPEDHRIVNLFESGKSRDFVRDFVRNDK